MFLKLNSLSFKLFSVFHKPPCLLQDTSRTVVLTSAVILPSDGKTTKPKIAVLTSVVILPSDGKNDEAKDRRFDIRDPFLYLDVKNHVL